MLNELHIDRSLAMSLLGLKCCVACLPEEPSESINVIMQRVDKRRMELKVVDDGIGLLEGFYFLK